VGRPQEASNSESRPPLSDRRSSDWVVPLASLAATLLLAFLAYSRTIASLINIYRHSDTFAYGFLVLPICLYLVWTSRDSIAPLTPRPYPLALLALIPLGLAWVAGRAASTLLVEQFSFVAMIPVLVIAHVGPRVARRLAFPLGFLFFAVPFGDVFQPRLMGITASFAEHALRLSGVAVAREGLYLITTTSRWHVIESCSGLRFTIAGVVLATLFAHECYRSNVKRAAFVASSVVASIIANGIRAYVLILIGHLTDLKLGHGMDHYAYGWLVFTIVMTSFFLVGAAFRDREPPGATAAEPPLPAGPRIGASRGRWAAIAGISVVALALWPALDALRPLRGGAAPAIAVEAPAPTGAWALEPVGPALWRPFFNGTSSETNRMYDVPDGEVQCFIGYYANQSQEHELLHVGNGIVDVNDPRWRIIHEEDRRIGSAPGFIAHETVLRVPEGHLVTWHWYWLPDEYTTSPVRTKLIQARARLLGQRDHAAVIVLSAVTPEMRDAEHLLAQFSGDMLPAIHRSVRRVFDAR
jgi:exosortase A